MNREKAKELWPIMKAFSEGRTIEFYHEDCKEWRALEDPNFSSLYNYRIKPESKIVPYSFEDAEYLLGLKIVSKEMRHATIIVSCSDTHVSYRGIHIKYAELLESYTTLDGKPLGKVVEG